MKLIPPTFFARTSDKVAPDLLGYYMCRRLNGEVIQGRITETEAYEPGDPACHGYRNKTKRNAAMWDKPGTIYVYVSYGIHHCLNVACTAPETPSALLIRALDLGGDDKRIAAGPGKLCKALGITLEQNYGYGDGQGDIWFEYGDKPNDVVQTTRIGITRGVEIPWRWYIKGDKSVSKK